jgi:hypothetical protein
MTDTLAPITIQNHDAAVTSLTFAADSNLSIATLLHAYGQHYAGDGITLLQFGAPVFDGGAGEPDFIKSVNLIWPWHYSSRFA